MDERERSKNQTERARPTQPKKISLFRLFSSLFPSLFPSSFFCPFFLFELPLWLDFSPKTPPVPPFPHSLNSVYLILFFIIFFCENSVFLFFSFFSPSPIPTPPSPISPFPLHFLYFIFVTPQIVISRFLPFFFPCSLYISTCHHRPLPWVSPIYSITTRRPTRLQVTLQWLLPSACCRLS